MVLPAVLHDLAADCLAARVELDVERRAAHEKIGVNSRAGADEHPEAPSVARLAEARQRDASGLERELAGASFHSASFNGRGAVELRRAAGLGEPARRRAAVPHSPVVALAYYQVAEERKLAGDYLPDAHHDRAVHIAFARSEIAVVREVAKRRADSDSVELAQDHLRPAAHRERVDEELLLELHHGGDEARGLLLLVAARSVRRRRLQVFVDDGDPLRDLVGGEVLRDGEELVLGDDLDLGPERAAEHHLVDAAREEAGDASADKADAHPAERLHRLRDADLLHELGFRLLRPRLGVDVEVRDAEPPHVVGVHVRGAERVVLEASALRIRLGLRPEEDRHLEALREHRRNDAERECEEVRDDEVGTVLLPLVEDFDCLAFEREHVVGRDHLDVG